jgi:hypothetical protein
MNHPILRLIFFALHHFKELTSGLSQNLYINRILTLLIH